MAEMYSYLDASDDPHDNQGRIREKARLMRQDGAVWMRVTMVDAYHTPVSDGGMPAGFWLEGWRERQKNDPPFDPPLTYAKAGDL